MPKVEKIRGLNLPGTPRTTLASRGIPLLYFTYFPILEAYDASLLDEGIDSMQYNSPAVKNCLGYAVAHLVKALCYKSEGSSPVGVIGIFH